MNKKDLTAFLETEKRLYKHCSEGKFDACKDWRLLMDTQGHEVIKALTQKVKRLEKHILRHQFGINL